MAKIREGFCCSFVNLNPEVRPPDYLFCPKLNFGQTSGDLKKGGVKPNIEGAKEFVEKFCK